MKLEFRNTYEVMIRNKRYELNIFHIVIQTGFGEVIL